MKNALLIMMPPPDLWGVRDMAVLRNYATSNNTNQDRSNIPGTWERDDQPMNERIREVIQKH